MSTAVFGTFFWNYAPGWIAEHASACFLSLVFLQLLEHRDHAGAHERLTERDMNRVRRFMLAGILVVLAFAVEPIIAAAGARSDADRTRLEAVGHRSQGAAARPFEVFGRIVAARKLWPGARGCGSASRRA